MHKHLPGTSPSSLEVCLKGARPRAGYGKSGCSITGAAFLVCSGEGAELRETTCSPFPCKRKGAASPLCVSQLVSEPKIARGPWQALSAQCWLLPGGCRLSPSHWSREATGHPDRGLFEATIWNSPELEIMELLTSPGPAASCFSELRATRCLAALPLALALSLQGLPSCGSCRRSSWPPVESHHPFHAVPKYSAPYYRLAPLLGSEIAYRVFFPTMIIRFFKDKLLILGS
ncbi:uncharacterized protein LOC114009378 [Tupaia chinensis]|uniref:uncharacterized protein LOC114009378 n=1 Tax=Tupaia chinensis TaxID=246437 RepID=UPI000FFB4272|nr:uncharacterized protein LOC114009378 [Tupaia chinensis]